MIKCMLDNNKYNNKPSGIEIGKITNRLTRETIEISIEDLAINMAQGCTFRPSVLEGSKETEWREQTLFALDFDKDTTIETELNRCKELNIMPVFAYTTFSHTEEKHKFRLVFCNDTVIKDFTIAKKLQLTLMSIFTNCDERCSNISRLFFGGRKLILNDYNNRINHLEILEKYPINIKENSLKSSRINGLEKCPPNNNKIYNNSYIIRGTKTPADEVKVKDDNYYNIKAIANRDVEYLRKKLNHPKMVFNNNQEFCDYIFKEINLGELLEFKYPTSIRCIFHEDSKPSASIFQNEEGYWIYNCFGCKVSYNLLGVIEMLGKFKSRPKAYKFIREIFNLEIQETEWQKEQKEILLENLKVINNGELEKNCPQAYKNIKSNIKYLNQLLLIAIDNVYNEKLTDNEDNVLFYASNKFIAKELNMNTDSSKEISKKTTLLAYHNLINKVSDDEANEDMVKRSQAISINSENKKYRHVNYYSIPSYNTLLFKEIEEQGNSWKDNNYTIKGLSREMFFRAEGKEVADKLYPQYKQVYDKNKKEVVDRTTTTKSDTRTNEIVKIIFSFFEIKNYVTEKEVIEELIASDLNIPKGEAEKQLKKSMKEILDSYCLKRIRCNKEIKETYRVVENGYPFIIVK